MSLLTRLLGLEPDDRDALRPLWYKVVTISRQPRWYADGGIADTVPGRFDTITLVLAAVLLRMEREEALIAPSVRLTELFVEDMDGQLREAGVGDLMVGKHIGKLISTMGGRLGAYRAGLTTQDNALADAVARNVSLGENGDPAKIAAMLRDLAASIADLPAKALLAGEIDA